MAYVQHNPNKDYRLPYSFYNMPIATQVMYRRIRALVDKFAKVNFPNQSIEYSRWCPVTHGYIRSVLTRTEAQRIFSDLYPPQIVGKCADIIIVDDLNALDESYTLGG